MATDTHRRKADGFNRTSDIGYRTSDYRGTSPQERLPCLRHIRVWPLGLRRSDVGCQTSEIGKTQEFRTAKAQRSQRKKRKEDYFSFAGLTAKEKASTPDGVVIDPDRDQASFSFVVCPGEKRSFLPGLPRKDECLNLAALAS